MTKRFHLLGLLAGILVVGGCTSNTPTDNGNHSNSNANQNDNTAPANDNTGGGSGGSLKINLAGFNGVETDMHVFIVLGDKIYTRAEYNQGLLTYECRNDSGSPGSLTCEYGNESLRPGEATTATIIAVDSGGGGTGPLTPEQAADPARTKVPDNAVEFVDFSQGDCSIQDLGVCSVPLGQAHEITVRFRKMHAVSLNWVGYGQVSTSVEGGAPGWLSVPANYQPFDYADVPVTSVRAPDTGLVLKQWYKKGTTVSFEALPDYFGSAFNRWEGECAGAQYLCEVTLEDADIDVTGHFQYWLCGGNVSTGNTGNCTLQNP